MKMASPATITTMTMALTTLFQNRIDDDDDNNNDTRISVRVLERSLNHLTSTNLKKIEETFFVGTDASDYINLSDGVEQQQQQQQQKQQQQQQQIQIQKRILAIACIRKIMYRYLDKFHSSSSSSSSSNQNISSEDVMEEALKYHVLPKELANELKMKYGSSSSSSTTTTTTTTENITWYDALEDLKVVANNDKCQLWRLLLEHPMTSYVPVQCTSCQHIIPDIADNDDNDNDNRSDKVIIKEIEPTGGELCIRGGWFRGIPRPAKILQITCPKCQHVNEWYRSGHPKIILTPNNKWGRLCGEQEDLRLLLANYINIPLRLIVPLDWDHIWSEFTATATATATTEAAVSSSSTITWHVEDDSARNFACRLDEGIGSWTRVWAIHSNPKLCEDVTAAYLSCRDQNNNGKDGRADMEHCNNMVRYKKLVDMARQDSTGQSTQAKTVYGYLLHQANMSDDDITKEMQRAAEDYGCKEWWQF